MWRVETLSLELLFFGHVHLKIELRPLSKVVNEEAFVVFILYHVGATGGLVALATISAFVHFNFYKC